MAKSKAFVDVPLPFGMDTRRRKGRCELATDKSVRAGTQANLIGPTDAALVASTRILAHALDVAETKRDPYAAAQVSKAMLANLTALGLANSPQTAADPFVAWLAEHDDDARAAVPHSD